MTGFAARIKDDLSKQGQQGQSDRAAGRVADLDSLLGGARSAPPAGSPEAASAAPSGRKDLRRRKKGRNWPVATKITEEAGLTLQEAVETTGLGQNELLEALILGPLQKLVEEIMAKDK